MTGPDDDEEWKGWAVGASSLLVAAFALLFLGFWVIADCRSAPGSGEACEQACRATFMRRWSGATAVVTVVMFPAAWRWGERCWIPVALVTVAAGALLVIQR
ncbi:hypothetical protein BH23ACT2_BH23ACT2_15900 [soil metagenome]